MFESTMIIHRKLLSEESEIRARPTESVKEKETTKGGRERNYINIVLQENIFIDLASFSLSLHEVLEILKTNKPH